MTDLSYDRRGSGPPLVLIHGLGSHRQVWSPVLDAVAEHHDVIALDLPGFGDSPHWTGPAPRPSPTAPAHPDSPGSGTAPSPETPLPGSVAHLADQVEAFLERLGIDTPAIAGNSLGGGIALELGRRGHARAVTAFAPIGFWTRAERRWCQTAVTAARTVATRLSPSLPRIMASPAGRSAFCALFYAHPARLDPAGSVHAARALAGAPGFAEARDAFTHLRPWSFAEAGSLPRIPVTIAWGTRDAILPFHQSRRARTILPTARHVTLPSAGHLPFSDAPTPCAALLTP
ncbi:hydrolase [Actinoplanes lobatus]|uniref:Hydrolase n=1 Tax=Actinoplanes lobatus TaxID=113568 RepID=A0A7W7HQW6_9ACTN|nr:alpha/beta fold hydrolase [Actinoplanes lobatus]MBB4754934.1 pimeloyl-ACP methyl ester carboxylesterase [Actinoplanes lobatus]GGN97090.1 hydrolase [Actinoplanes lobatus]GIE44536.1 hydrolase [Actinoplanes lobatus]